MSLAGHVHWPNHFEMEKLYLEVDNSSLEDVAEAGLQVFLLFLAKKERSEILTLLFNILYITRQSSSVDLIKIQINQYIKIQISCLVNYLCPLDQTQKQWNGLLAWYYFSNGLSVPKSGQVSVYNFRGPENLQLTF